jgi:peptide chain release factor 1
MQALEEASTLLNDPDPSMRTLASDEYDQLSATMATLLNSTFPKLLIPPSPTSNVSAMLELKAGVGGDEAALFAGDLLRMYQRYGQVWGDELSSRNRSGEDGGGHARGGWTANIMSQNELTIGKGVKEAIIEIKGPGSYDSLRWETGVHRVQRVPATESGGRLHTSAVAVAVSHRNASGNILFLISERSFLCWKKIIKGKWTNLRSRSTRRKSRLK